MPALIVRQRVFGLSLAANEPIPGLAQGDGPVDVRVVLRQPLSWADDLAVDADEPFYTSPFSAPNGQPVLVGWTLQGGSYFRFVHQAGVDCVLSRSGGELWADWQVSPDFDPHEFLLGPIFGLILRLRGALTLHAAAVVLDRRVVLIAGPQRAGKSTLAAQLARRGHAVMTDDLAAVVRGATGFTVWAGPAWLRLRREAAATVAPSWPSDVLTPSPDGAHVDLRLPDAGIEQPSSAVPIAGILLLEPRRDHRAAPRMEPVAPGEALMALAGDTWATRLQDRALRAQEFAALAALVSETPVFRLGYQLGSNWTPDAASAIEQCLTIPSSVGAR